MKGALINCLREEERLLEEEIFKETRLKQPNQNRIAALRQQAAGVRRQLDSIP